MIVRLAALIAAALATVAFAGVLQPSGALGAEADPARGGLTVDGSGSVDVTPDRAGFAFGTVTQARTAAAAVEASSAAVARIVGALRREGIAQADIQTAEVSLSPRWNEAGDTIVGYAASNTVNATVRRLGTAGSIVDAAVAAGANQISGPNLLSSDRAAAYRNALRAAIADARVKAQALAAAAGVTVGAITAVAEGGSAPPPMASRESLASDAQIEPGTQEIQATVSVTFALG